MKLKESKVHPGFYEIPDYPNYLVNREGDVYSLVRNRLIGYRRDGSRADTIGLRVDGELFLFRRKRLTSILFEGVPELSVGRKPVFKTMAPKVKKRIRYNSPWAISIQRVFVVRCLITKQEEVYNDINLLVEDFDVSWQMLLKTLREEPVFLHHGHLAITVIENRHYLDQYSGISYKNDPKKTRAKKPVLAINDSTGVITIYPSIKAAADEFGMSFSSIAGRLKGDIKTHLGPDEYRFCLYSDYIKTASIKNKP